MKNPAIDKFIGKHPKWEKELNALLKVIRKSKMEETIKWGMPVFCIDGKNVLGIGAFKSYFGLWYYNGSFLKDKSKVLLNAQSGKTKAMRQWRFTDIKEINVPLIHQYNLEAIANEKAGKKIKPQAKKFTIAVPLADAFKTNKKLKAAFDKLTRGRQNEVLEYISSAKRIATQVSRTEKCIPLILEGKTPNDKYKK